MRGGRGGLGKLLWHCTLYDRIQGSLNSFPHARRTELIEAIDELKITGNTKESNTTSTTNFLRQEKTKVRENKYWFVYLALAMWSRSENVARRGGWQGGKGSSKR